MIMTKMKKAPAWFKLSKYKNTKKLDLQGWYLQFLVRSYAKMTVDNIHFLESSPRKSKMPLNNEQSDYLKSLKLNIDNLLKKIEIDPIFSPKTPDAADGGHEEAGDFFSPTECVLRNDINHYGAFRGCGESPWEQLAVRPLTARDVAWIIRGMEKNKYDCLNELALSADFGDTLPEEARIAQAWMDDPIHYHLNNATTKSLGVLSLDFSDDVLKAHFEKILSKFRRGHPCQELRSSPEPIKMSIPKWIKWAVLPYIDLKLLWADFNGVEITIPGIANAIYPEGEGSDDLVRTSTKETAEEVLSKQFLNNIRIQAACEKTI
ncbi:MAG: hypothetical protein HQM09_21480 [Candidatus Riflebacteria bacterium]|nr:hypothetical protein [Candidatus Riflebacteria bacterium]